MYTMIVTIYWSYHNIIGTAVAAVRYVFSGGISENARASNRPMTTFILLYRTAAAEMTRHYTYVIYNIIIRIILLGDFRF